MATKRNLKTPLVMSLFLLAIVSTAGAEIIYVDADASTGGDGQTWGTAYRNDTDPTISEVNTTPIILTSPFSGTITADSTMAASVGTYIITGDVIVNQGVTLTIEPNVTLKFEPDTDDQSSGDDTNRAELRVNGALIADGGNDTSRINFTSNSPSPSYYDWGGIEFTDTSDDTTCILRYCDIKYAGGIWTRSFYCAIGCESASPRIESCRIEEFGNEWWFMETYGIICYNSTTLLQNNYFSSSAPWSAGIEYQNAPTPVHILNNIIANVGYLGIYIHTSTINVINNTITNCYDIGIYEYNCIPIITNNIIVNNKRGIVYSSPKADPGLSYNNVWNNSESN